MGCNQLTCTECQLAGKCHVQSELYCDFCHPPHRVENADVHRIPGAEVAQYAELYAQILLDHCLPPVLLDEFKLKPSLKVAVLDDLIGYARGEAEYSLNTQVGDWCVCKRMFDLWEAGKKTLACTP